MNDELGEVQKFVQDFKVPFPIVIDNTGDLVYKYRVRGHPTTIFLNKEGVITAIIAGYTSPERLQEEISKASK